MNDDDLCLAVDLGTGGLKVGLVTMAGVIRAFEVHEVATHFSDDGGATQDAGEWWDLIVGAARRLVGSVAGAPESVVAVAVTGQWASTVPVDDAGRPTGDCLTWLDTRGVRLTRGVLGGPLAGYRPDKLLRYLRRSGAAPSVESSDPTGQILYLEAERPDVVARTRWYMEPVDYLTMRFTGVASATHASRAAMWATDNRHLDVYRYDPRLLRSVGLTDERLPPLVPFGSVVGSLAPGVAAALGLGESTVVITGVPDLHAGSLGAGATRAYETHLALSTTSWISCPVPAKKTDVVHQMMAGPGLTNDSYLIYNNQETGARALAWYRDVLGATDAAPDFDGLTALASTSRPGAGGVLFSPWLVGERSPVADRRLRAGFTNLSLATTQADLVRAVMEGVAANSRWLFRYVERFAGRQLSPVRLLGGGAQSALWCQVYANTLDREVEQVPQPIVAQLRGAAMLAAVALGHRTMDELSTRRERGRVFTPDAADAAGYQRRAEQLVALYRRDRRWRRQQRRRSP